MLTHTGTQNIETEKGFYLDDLKLKMLSKCLIIGQKTLKT